MKILLPLAWLYGGLTDARNYRYDRGLRASFRFGVRTVAVGNLAVGGTGKTPHVEYLLRLLMPHYALATLSRGYGRRTRGFRLADQTATPTSLGDEPMQLYRKFGDRVTVAVGEERALAIPSILLERPATQVILLDDAFQHRPVNPHLNLLLTDYHRPFFRDFPFPAGRLRERRAGARRADAVIVTKCPAALPDAERRALTDRIRHYARPDAPVFFSTVRYGPPRNAAGQPLAVGQPVVLVSGLANAKPLKEYAAATFALRQHLRYADHRAYAPRDAQTMRAALAAHPGATLLTTEKDFVKLSESALGLADVSLFYLPIEVAFLPANPPLQAGPNPPPDFDTWTLARLAAVRLD